LSRVHWGFLASELRALPQTTDAAQAVIDPVIEGMGLLFSGQQWPDAAAAYVAAYVAADASAYVADAVADAADAAADAAAHAAADAAAYTSLCRPCPTSPARHADRADCHCLNRSQPEWSKY